jgi:TM2 domain-containing membrane protein YozV
MKKNCKKIVPISIVCFLLLIAFSLMGYGIGMWCTSKPCAGFCMGAGIGLLASAIIIIAFCLMDDDDKQSDGERYLDDVNTGISVLRKLLELNKELK